MKRKLSYRKADRAMRHGRPGLKISGVHDYAHGYFSRNSWWAFFVSL